MRGSSGIDLISICRLRTSSWSSPPMMSDADYDDVWGSCGEWIQVSSSSSIVLISITIPLDWKIEERGVEKISQLSHLFSVLIQFKKQKLFLNERVTRVMMMTREFKILIKFKKLLKIRLLMNDNMPGPDAYQNLIGIIKNSLREREGENAKNYDYRHHLGLTLKFKCWAMINYKSSVLWMKIDVISLLLSCVGHLISRRRSPKSHRCWTWRSTIASMKL